MRGCRGVVLLPVIREMFALETVPPLHYPPEVLSADVFCVFDALLHQTVGCLGGWCVFAIDSTGHSSQYASVCYAQRSAPERQQRKRYTRNQIAMKTKSQIIIAQRVARGPHYEAKESLSLIRKTRVVHSIGYSVDKAYDSEEIRRVVREEVRAAHMIPLRKRAKSGTHRVPC